MTFQDAKHEVYENYRSTIASSYWPRKMSLQARARQYSQRWARFLPRDCSIPILDLGCGGGEFLWFLQQLGYTNLHGVDVSPEQIEAAKSIGVENVEVADALEYLRRYPNTYALINAQSFLEHLTRDELLRVMDATAKALLPGGLLLAVAPNSKSLFSARVRYADLTHELSFTPKSVVQLCNLAGLEVVTIREHGPVVHGLKSAVRWMVW